MLLSIRGRRRIDAVGILPRTRRRRLDEIPGLVYARRRAATASPRNWSTPASSDSLGDLDELPDPVLGYRLLEAAQPPRDARRRSAVASDRVRRLSPISSIVLTFGCKFACPYCPIPAYNQRQHRVKSGGRIAEEMWRLQQGLRAALLLRRRRQLLQHTSRARSTSSRRSPAPSSTARRLCKKARWYTEVTVHDTLQMKEHLPLVRESGCRALWLGVEDMTATLVNKGQSVDKTHRGVPAAARRGHLPDADDDAPRLPAALLARKQLRPAQPDQAAPQGRRGVAAGADDDAVGRHQAVRGDVHRAAWCSTASAAASVAPHMYDGNYVVASKHPRPWRKQLNLLLGYLYFYNPVWLAGEPAAEARRKVSQKPADMQMVGMLGLTQTIRRTFGWALRLMFGRIERLSAAPTTTLPVRSVDDARPATGRWSCRYRRACGGVRCVFRSQADTPGIGFKTWHGPCPCISAKKAWASAHATRATRATGFEPLLPLQRLQVPLDVPRALESLEDQRVLQPADDVFHDLRLLARSARGRRRWCGRPRSGSARPCGSCSRSGRPRSKKSSSLTSKPMPCRRIMMLSSWMSP